MRVDVEVFEIIETRVRWTWLVILIYSCFLWLTMSLAMWLIQICLLATRRALAVTLFWLLVGVRATSRINSLLWFYSLFGTFKELPAFFAPHYDSTFWHRPADGPQRILYDLFSKRHVLASRLLAIDFKCNKHFMDSTELHKTFQIEPKCAFDQKSINRCGPPIDIIRYI